MAKKAGLGRGLNAVFAEINEDEEPESQASETQEHQAEESPKETPSDEGAGNIDSEAIISATGLKLPEGITCDENGTLWIDPKLLKPNPRQPRKYFDDDKLLELAESVKADGVLQPVTIEDAEDGSFYIIAGERRTRASLLAGLEKIPVQLKKYSDEKKLIVALIENIQRTDLNPVEEAQAYYKLMEIANLTQDQVAERVGKNRSTVANCLRLLKLPEDLQRALIEGTLSSGHARAILSLDTDTDMRILYGKIMGQGMSVRQAEACAKEMKEGAGVVSGPHKPKVDKRDPNLIALESKMIEALGTKVQVKGDFDKGAVTITYFSKEDLDKIFTRIAPNAGL